jgi:hypothetical protein
MSGIIPINYRYAWPIQSAADNVKTSAFLLYAIAETETIDGELAGMWDAASVVSADGGHGLFQLTSSYPSFWEDPRTNAQYAAANFVIPAWSFWATRYDLVGDALVRAVAAEFNAGRANALAGYTEHGDVGFYTTKQNGTTSYDRVVLGHYHELLGAKQ